MQCCSKNEPRSHLQIQHCESQISEYHTSSNTALCYAQFLAQACALYCPPQTWKHLLLTSWPLPEPFGIMLLRLWTGGVPVPVPVQPFKA